MDAGTASILRDVLTAGDETSPKKYMDYTEYAQESTDVLVDVIMCVFGEVEKIYGRRSWSILLSKIVDFVNKKKTGDDIAKKMHIFVTCLLAKTSTMTGDLMEKLERIMNIPEIAHPSLDRKRKMITMFFFKNLFCSQYHVPVEIFDNKQFTGLIDQFHRNFVKGNTKTVDAYILKIMVMAGVTKKDYRDDHLFIDKTTCRNHIKAFVKHTTLIALIEEFRFHKSESKRGSVALDDPRVAEKIRRLELPRIVIPGNNAFICQKTNTSPTVRVLL